jgi:hypothetical protein
MDSPPQKFFVSDDGKEKVSITKAELQAGIDSGKHTDESLAWTKGMGPAWLPLSDPYWEKHGIVIEQEPPELPPLPKSPKQDCLTETSLPGGGGDSRREEAQKAIVSLNSPVDYDSPRRPRCCLSCGEILQKKPIKTFLGFRKARCVKCKELSKFPLTKFHLVSYWIVIGPILLLQIALTYGMLKAGFLFLPGFILFFAFLVTPYCLFRDRQIYKKCAGQLNHLREVTNK